MSLNSVILLQPKLMDHPDLKSSHFIVRVEQKKYGASCGNPVLSRVFADFSHFNGKIICALTLNMQKHFYKKQNDYVVSLRKIHVNILKYRVSHSEILCEAVVAVVVYFC